MYHWMKIDTDPEENLVLFIQNSKDRKMKIISITGVQFTEFTYGYLVVYEQLS